MARGPLVAVIVVLCSPILSACLDEGRPLNTVFEAVEAPEWSAGHSWTYSVSTTFEGERLDDNGRESYSATDKQEVTLTVFNTTQPVGEETAYYLRSDHDDSVIALFFHGNVQAVSAKTLTPLAYGYAHWMSSAQPVPRVYDDYDIGCEQHPSLQPIDALGATSLAFPLEADKTWLGYADPYATQQLDTRPILDSKVEGRHAVTVPAGTFDSVRVHTHGVALPARDTMGGTADYESFIDYGYEAEQVVRGQVRFKFGGAEITSTMEVAFELVSFSLDSLPEAPAPTVYGAQLPPPLVHIVSTEAFPFNAADGPRTVSFGLVEGEQAYSSKHGDPPFPAVSVQSPLPDSLPFDPAEFKVIWTMVEDHDRTVEIGDSFSHIFTNPGLYTVMAVLVATSCSGSGTMAYVTLPVNLDITGFANPPTGSGRTVDVFEVDVFSSIIGTLMWETPSGVDAGHPEVISPRGQTEQFPSSLASMEYPFFEDGTYRIRWNSGSISLDDSADIRLILDYSTWLGSTSGDT